MSDPALKGKTDESDLYEALGLYQHSREGGQEPPRILPLLSSVLEKSVQGNDISLEDSRRKYEVTIFHGSKAPGISIRQYLDRIFRPHDNAYHAKVGGVNTAEMNRLEMKLLFSLEFRLHVTPETFRKYCYKIEKGSIDNHQLKKDEIKRTPKTPGYGH